MCKAKEIYCRHSHCLQPVGWHIVESCKASTLGNYPFGGGGWNWGAFSSGCTVPRIVRRQRCKYTSCTSCVRRSMDSTLSGLETWTENARGNPELQEESLEDSLLLRRRKKALRDEQEQAQKGQGKQRAADADPTFNFDGAEIWQNPFDTLNTLPTITDTFASATAIATALDMYSAGPPHIYPIAGSTGDNFEEGMLLAMQNLETPAPGLSTSNLGYHTGLDHANPLQQTVYQPPGILSTAQQGANELETVAQSRADDALQGDFASISVLDYEDSFWNEMLALDGDSLFDPLLDAGSGNSASQHPPG